MTLVKICGITNLEDAMVAIEAGADALGFNFYPRSPRYVSSETVAEIVKQLPGEILKVGVFVNEPSPEIKKIASESGINAIQLHGDESNTYCRELSEFFVIKTFAVGPHFEPESVQLYEVGGVMLDASHKELRGGTGCRVDLDVAKAVGKLTDKLFLAGGLSPSNVAEAVVKVQPYTVDVCSSIESTPGRKDRELVWRFVNQVRQVDTRNDLV